MQLPGLKKHQLAEKENIISMLNSFSGTHDACQQDDGSVQQEDLQDHKSLVM